MKDEAIPNRPRARRRNNRGSTQNFSGHVYTRDGTNGATSLPRRLAGRVLRKPFGLLSEVAEATGFERRSHRHSAGESTVLDVFIVKPHRGLRGSFV